VTHHHHHQLAGESNENNNKEENVDNTHFDTAGGGAGIATTARLAGHNDSNDNDKEDGVNSVPMAADITEEEESKNIVVDVKTSNVNPSNGNEEEPATQ